MKEKTNENVGKKYHCFWVYDTDADILKDAKNECSVSMAEFLRQCVSYGFDDAVKALKQKKAESKRTLFLEQKR